jgi:hypothetical protein
MTMLGPSQQRYLNLTIVLPDGRMLLQRREVAHGDFLPWGCTIERAVKPNEDPSAIARGLLQQFNFFTTKGSVTRMFPVHTYTYKTITPVVAKCGKMLRFKAPKLSNYRAVPMPDLEEEMAASLLNAQTGKCKFSDISIAVIKALHQRGIEYE